MLKFLSGIFRKRNKDLVVMKYFITGFYAEKEELYRRIAEAKFRYICNVRTSKDNLRNKFITSFPDNFHVVEKFEAID